MRYTNLLPFMALLAVGGCSGGTDFPPEPVLTYVSIEPKTIKQITDSVTITFKFTDGDGDLGLYHLDGEDTLKSVLYLTDTRIDTDTLFPPAIFLWEYPINQDLMPASKKVGDLKRSNKDLSSEKLKKDFF